jgi:hypothetical protein
MAKVRVQVSLFKDPIEVEESEIPNLRTQGSLSAQLATQPAVLRPLATAAVATASRMAARTRRP